MMRSNSVSKAVAELLIRHHLGHFEPRVRARLREIFASNPPDALQRLERAARYLGVTGGQLGAWAEEVTRAPKGT